MMIKKIMISAVITVLLLTVYIVFLYESPDAEDIPAEKPVPVEAAFVKRGDLVTSLSYNGTVQDEYSAMLSSKVSAEVNALYVTEGEQVARGTVLAELNHRDFDLKLETFKSRLDVATMNADYCSDMLAKYETLLDEGAVSKQQYDEADLKYRLAKAEVRTAEANLKELEAALDVHYIRAPQNGIVTGILTQQGDMAMPGKPLMAFSGGKDKKVVVSVVQEDLYLLDENTPAVVTWGENSLNTKVSRILPSIDPATNTATVEIILQNNHPAQGTAVEVGFITNSKKDVLLVPSEAIVDTSEGTFAFIIRRDKASLTRITVGSEDKGLTEVISGLEEGQCVACGDLGLLKDNGSVYVVGGEKP